MESTINLGISSCLLGNHVRYDGNSSWDRFLTDTLGRYVKYVPVCPEVECGLGVPRDFMRQVGDVNTPRLVTTRTGKDFTDKMISWAHTRVVELEQENLCGFIFKKNSPSSGMERVKVYNEKGVPVKKGIGIFARIFIEHFPLLPVEEDGRLHDVILRENFIERIFTLKRWREIFSRKISRGDLVVFHTRHKLLILSHSTKHCQTMGKLIASLKDIPFKELYTHYERLLMEALALKATRKKHANVLQHMMGYFKKQLASDEKQELLDSIDHYREGSIPLIVPITLINHYVRKYDQPYLKQQNYLNPHPLELQLRNHV
jgi:uncharacterized protein YbgA (DUF1722 family)/uncharacterized protein YbbK (DUF523 family)